MSRYVISTTTVCRRRPGCRALRRARMAPAFRKEALGAAEPSAPPGTGLEGLPCGMRESPGRASLQIPRAGHSGGHQRLHRSCPVIRGPLAHRWADAARAGLGTSLRSAEAPPPRVPVGTLDWRAGAGAAYGLRTQYAPRPTWSSPSHSVPSREAPRWRLDSRRQPCPPRFPRGTP